MFSQKAVDQLLVFGWMHRAGGIHQLAAGLEQRQQAHQQLPLQGGELRDRLRGNPPTGIGMAGQGAQARARSIQEDAIKTVLPLRPRHHELAGIGGQGVHAAQAQACRIDRNALEAPL